MLQGCYHSNSKMGQRVAMAPRSQGQREGLGRWLIPAILGVLIMNGAV